MKPFKMQNVKPMKFIGYKPTLAQLKRRAKKYGMTIRKYERSEDSYLLVDVYTNAAVAPEPMTLAEIERELDDNKKLSTASKKFSSKPKTALTRQANRKLSATVKTIRL